MAQWADGYISESTYPWGYCRQASPAWLAMAALLAGHRPPALDRPFTWCDVGCGQGLTPLGVAACHPQATVFGFDFNPSHTDNARVMAAAAGLGNAHFHEISFEALADAAPGAYPPMDFIVLHGVWSWVSAAQRVHLSRFIRDRLAPGGIVYLAHNALAGWAAMLPVQRLLRLMLEIEPGPPGLVMRRGLDMMAEIQARDSEFFANNPVVARRLAFLAKQDLQYLPHELLHGSWEPTPFDAVAHDMSTAKCDFIGSATLLENLPAFATPPKMAELVARTGDIRLQEALKDFGAGRMFRRDLYRRGGVAPPAGEINARLDELVLMDLGHDEQVELKIQTFGDQGLALRMDVYGPILRRLRSGPMPVAELRRAVGDAHVTVEVISVLAATNIAHPTPSPQPDAAQMRATAALNRELDRHNRQGGAIHFQMAPCLGTALVVDAIETMIVQAFGDGEIEALVTRLMSEGGRPLLQDGKPFEDVESHRRAWRTLVETFMKQRLGLFQRAGIIQPG
jgi:hypothetical protein